MTAMVLARALDPWPAPLRTFDALHLASVEFLRAHGQDVKLASYGRRHELSYYSIAIGDENSLAAGSQADVLA